MDDSPSFKEATQSIKREGCPFPFQTMPYVFEDRTGVTTNTDYDELYDRQFFRVRRVPQTTTTMVYNTHHRSLRHRDSYPLAYPNAKLAPVAVLEFQPDENLGTVQFPLSAPIPMGKYMQRTSFFGGSLSRKFLASDGREYRWSYRTLQGQEWTCVTGSENVLVAHYDLKPLGVQTYGSVSGNNLTVYEPFLHIMSELLTSLTIMRHIAQFNL